MKVNGWSDKNVERQWKKQRQPEAKTRADTQVKGISEMVRRRWKEEKKKKNKLVLSALFAFQFPTSAPQWQEHRTRQLAKEEPRHHRESELKEDSLISSSLL